MNQREERLEMEGSGLGVLGVLISPVGNRKTSPLMPEGSVCCGFAVMMFRVSLDSGPELSGALDLAGNFVNTL